MRRRLAPYGLALALTGLLPAGQAPAAGPKPAPPTGAARRPAPSGPVQIRSDSLKVLQKQRRAVFAGQVETIQGDLTIRCQRLDVRYTDARAKPAAKSAKSAKSTEGAGSEIRSMVFSGDVRIEQGQRRGHCERAEYDRPAGRIVCTGDPWVIEGDNRIRGARIVYLLERDEVQVTRPRAVIDLPAESPGTAPGGRRP